LKQAGEPDLKTWVGREEVREDIVTPAHALGAAALFDRPDAQLHPGDPLPRGWHWFYFNPAAPQSALGPDGHPRRGGFLPPVPLPRRMWASGSLRFHGPLRIGTAATRRSRVAAVEEKDGRSGKLVFVTVHHAITDPARLVVEEEQQLVYREAPKARTPTRADDPAPTDFEWSETFTPDPITLFRFSALTFNGHRIHYDHPYATGVEGYHGLVVHAPLTALLVLQAAERRVRRKPRAFQFQSVDPLFSGEPITLGGRTRPDGKATEAWAAGPTGMIAMKATVEWGD